MGARSRLPLNALRVLEAVGRHGSLAAAADALHVEPSAVSMQMKTLADYVGAPLLRRTGRGVALTAIAEQLLPAVTSGLQQIDDALRLARQGPRHEFRLSVLPSFLLLWLLPRIPELMRLSDALGRRLAVSASKAPVDLAMGEADAAIRLGPGGWPGLHAEKLLDETLVPVCAPDLARRVGRVEPGQTPAGATLLASRLDPWERWIEGADAVRPAESLTIDDAAAVVMSAERGMGVALARGCLVAGALREGRLVQVGAAMPYRYAYHWVSTPAVQADAVGTALADALRAAARAR
jgi:LysR family transcriptional regulator, glycine cleavage system transcriptional activator